MEEAEEPWLDDDGLLRCATIQADDFAVVAIDGHLRFERLDQIERFEDVLHRIVVAIRSELHFEFAGHRTATNADDERAAIVGRRYGLNRPFGDAGKFARGAGAMQETSAGVTVG